MATDGNIITEEEVRYWANVPNTGSDDALQHAILAAEDEASKLLGYTLDLDAAHVEYQDAIRDNKIIVLGKKNVFTTPALDLFYDVVSEFAADTEIDDDVYTVDLDEGIIFLQSAYAFGNRRWKISCKAGWDTTDNLAPRGLRYAVASLASVYWDRMDKGQVGVIADNVGESIFRFDPLIPQDIMAMLNGYKRYVIT